MSENRRQTSDQGEKYAIFWLTEDGKLYFSVFLQTSGEVQAIEQAENRCTWQCFVSTKRDNIQST